MHLYTQNAKTTHFRCGGDGWFRACWGARPKPWRTQSVLVRNPSDCGDAILRIANIRTILTIVK